MFLCDFTKIDNTYDAVENSIVLTKACWEIFGKKDAGWSCYAKTFGLSCLDKLNKGGNKKYFDRNTKIEDYDWKEYNTLLDSFKKERFIELSSKY